MSSTPTLSDTKLYRVQANTPVFLRVEIGNAMVGGTSILHDNVTREIGDEEVQIGVTGQDLRLSILHCATTVRDINPHTNRTVVTYHLRGGVDDQAFSYTLDVNVPGGHARYLINFAFV